MEWIVLVLTQTGLLTRSKPFTLLVVFFPFEFCFILYVLGQQSLETVEASDQQNVGKRNEQTPSKGISHLKHLFNQNQFSGQRSACHIILFLY